MTIPPEYGGHGRGFLERFAVAEELLAAGAPVGFHWIADRQVAPSLLRFGTEEQKQAYLPRIAAGECSFAIGMSEPDSGSDLASVRSRAEKVDGGWRVTGTKVWTSGAHEAEAFIALVRTAPADPQHRHDGLSQLIVELRAPGVRISPIISMTGRHHFNEVHLDGVFIPDERLLGDVGSGWRGVTSELAYERSGPERFLETYYVLTELVRAVGDKPDARSAEGIGRLVAQVHTMRRMSVSVAGMLHAGKEPVVEAAIVKDIGTVWEQQLPHRVRDLAAFVEEDAGNRETLEQQLSFAIKTAPKLTIQGGTTEVLRGIIARGLGLR
jgi:acyl-CoA dehydrogenase